MNWRKIVLSISGLLVAMVAISAPFSVVIDAGHGGKDPGAVGRNAREKDINLAIALGLGEQIRSNHKDVKVIYTRSSDVFVELQERANIANRSKANLFISIHTNASTNRSAYGTETYTLGLRRSNENLEVAKRENSVILMEDNYEQKYEGFDPRSSESYIMFDMIQNTNMGASIDFASSIQGQFADRAGRRNNGVRQDVFLVLRNTGMPSVLVELGYISNAEEERFLMSESGKRKMVESIYQAFSRYKSEHDSRNSGAAVVAKPSSSAKDTPRAEENVDTSRTSSKSSDSVAARPSSSKEDAFNPADFYTIQFLLSSTKLSSKSSRFHGIKPTGYYVQDRVYKYYYGQYRTREEAMSRRSEVSRRFKDAFVIHLRDGKRIND